MEDSHGSFQGIRRVTVVAKNDEVPGCERSPEKLGCLPDIRHSGGALVEEPIVGGIDPHSRGTTYHIVMF